MKRTRVDRMCCSLPIAGAGGIARAAGSSLAGVGGPAIAGLSAGRAEAAPVGECAASCTTGIFRIAWNLPSLHDFVHRGNAKPSNTYSLLA
jgi:hypothetical protein